jgi:hypothetical protein
VKKVKKFPMKLSSGILFSSVGEYIHFHGFDWFLPTMDDQTNPLSGLLVKDLFTAARTNLRWNIFHQDWFSINLEYFTYKFCAGLCGTANMAFEHGYLRFLNSIHSLGSGSYKVMILTIGVSAKDTCIWSGRFSSVNPSIKQLGENLSSG